MTVRVATLWRYPVKGLSPEPLDRVSLEAGECVPHDRRFAIARASSRFDENQPKWLPKKNFITRMRDEKLAQLESRFDEQSGMLTLEREGRLLLREPVTEPAGRARIDGFLAAFLKETVPDPPRVVESRGHAFADAKREPNAATDKYISLINLASTGALQSVLPVAMDPLRFRANFYCEGAAAWAELDWVGAKITVGSVRLHVVSPIVRCAAIDVNPATAARDSNLTRTLRRAFGHVHMGVYAEVIGGGCIRKGDLLLPP